MLLIGNHSFEVRDKGTRFYSFILVDNWFQIQISESNRGKLPTAYVQIKSELLNCQGLDFTVSALRSAMSLLLGNIEKEAVSRADIFIDFTTDISFEAFDKSLWIRRAENFRYYYSGEVFTGITIGLGGDIAARLYNKTIEIVGSNKEYFKSIWQKNGWSGDKQVWRLEHELKRNFLSQMSVVTIDDLRTIINDIWFVCTHEWLRLAIDDGTQNKSRWETHPVWVEIGLVRFERGTFAGVHRKVPKTRFPDEKRLYLMGISYLTSYAAVKGYNNLKEIIENFVDDALKHLNELFINSRQYLDGHDYIKKKIELKTKQYNKSLEIEDI